MFGSNRKALVVVRENIRPLAEETTSMPLPTDSVSQTEIWGLIAAHTGRPSYARDMALSCRLFYHSTLKVLRQWKLPRLAQWVVVEPTLENVDKILTAMFYDRSLLYTKIDEVMDRTGHRIIKEKTLYQLAYGAGDDDLVRKMEAVYIEALGEEEAKRVLEQQRNEMLESKEEYEQNEAACLAHLEDVLVPMITAINAEPFNGARDEKNRINLRPETLAAIDIFKIAIAESQPKEINRGMHFRYSLMQAVYDRLVTLAAHWNYHHNKRALYEDVVIATLQAYVPAYDAMQLSQELIYEQRANNPEACKRLLALRHGGSNYYDVVRGGSLDFVLLGSCVQIYYCTHAPAPMMRSRTARVFETYVKQKQQTCSFMQPDQQSKSRCIIC